jgi:predicted nucleic acid-binding protein
MPKFALDTSVYISAFRDAAKAAELTEFLAAFLSVTYLSAVVVQELRAGARTRAQSVAFEEIVGPFDQRGRVFVPSATAYTECGRVLAELASTGQVGSPIRASFLNDLRSRSRAVSTESLWSLGIPVTSV